MRVYLDLVLHWCDGGNGDGGKGDGGGGDGGSGDGGNEAGAWCALLLILHLSCMLGQLLLGCLGMCLLLLLHQV